MRFRPVKRLPVYGKHFERMYQGSMRGAGSDVFAVWGYVISHVKGDSLVEVNPEIVAFLIGMGQERVEAAMAFLTAPDTKSRNKEHEGRRLVKRGEFEYYVPSAAYYRGVKSPEDLREYNRMKQRECRERKDSPNGNGKLPAPERISMERQLKDARAEIKSIRDSFPLEKDDPRRTRLTELKAVETKLKDQLDLVRFPLPS